MTRARAMRLVGAGVLTVIAIGVAASAAFYIAAPVDQLRDALVYLPAGSATTREAGLGVDAVALDEIPETLLVALLFNEDKKFFTHHGFDLEEIANSVSDWVRGRQHLRGASTLTQQLARTIFLSRERTITRKVLEAIETIKLERHFSKDEILSLYVNNVEWGPHVYGVGAAAAYYFRRKPAELEPLQSVFLVAILPSTARLAADFGKRPLKRATMVRMRRLIAGVRRATARGERSTSDDPVTLIVPAVRDARHRAYARRVAP